MNFIYLHTHDLGDFTGAYGKSEVTPNLDRLAGESVVFENAFAAAPTCSPSRAALLTGQYPHQAGMLGLAHRGFELDRPERHLANLLSAQGYETALSGIQHEFPSADAAGFPYGEAFGTRAPHEGESRDDYLRRRDIETGEAAAEWLKNRKSDSPFMLSVGFHQPHRPLPRADADLLKRKWPVPYPLNDDSEVQEDLASLQTSIRIMDEAAGKVIEGLKAAGYWDNTIVLFTTDHGIAFPGQKCTLRSGGNKVALFLRHPEKDSLAGKQISATITQLDILPTLFEWLGLDCPGWCEGRSLQPLMTGEVDALHDEIFGEVNFHAACEPMRSVRTDKYLLIKRFDEAEKWILANIDDCLSKSSWMKSDAYRNGPRELELYDLKTDPSCQVNLAGSRGLESVQAALETRLQEWMVRTEDPILKGELKRPANARINHPDSMSPAEPFYERDLVVD